MLCGVDEAGRGPVFGPMIVAGVNFENDKILNQNNIRDSKKITPKRREYLSNIIRKHAEKIEVIQISASDIDDMRRIMTLNELEVNVFGLIIQKLRPEICYVDSADVNDIRFGNNILAKLDYKPTIISKHKADDIYPIVGAASIIAKTIRDKEIRKIESELRKKLNLPLGSGYPADPITKNFLIKWVDNYNTLPPHTRASWKTSQTILKNKQIKKLDDF